MNTLIHIRQKYCIPSGQSPIYIEDFRREHLGAISKELGFTLGAEIGVLQGRFSIQLCLANPNLHLLCIDPYVQYEDYTDETGNAMSDFYYHACLENLKNHNCEIIREFSLEAVKKIPNNSLDFVFIDGNHAFDHVVNDLTQWSKKVKIGGIISGHDYRVWPREANIHVKEAVDAFTLANYINPWYFADETFFWVKE
jgi:predicted O-methyltransferase YrrM